jgi:hypothetical protein
MSATALTMAREHSLWVDERCEAGISRSNSGHTLQVFFTTYARWIDGDGDRNELAKAVGKTWPERGRVKSGILSI